MRRSWCCRSGTTSLAHQIRSPSVSLTSPPPSARDDKLGGIRRANTVAEFTQVIRKFSEIGEQELMRIALENKNLFNKYYTFETAKKLIKRILENLVQLLQK